ncbi:hypothetical protein U9M48_043410 [Paspalum notatum var. saurae]|uniref:Uncharacterized protein n=1 Tax=Paspalum notatum var. saurae TaxID=547442 RepID=A0AAQ3UT37_PASNO
MGKHGAGGGKYGCGRQQPWEFPEKPRASLAVGVLASPLARAAPPPHPTPALGRRRPFPAQHGRKPSGAPPTDASSPAPPREQRPHPTLTLGWQRPSPAATHERERPTSAAPRLLRASASDPMPHSRSGAAPSHGAVTGTPPVCWQRVIAQPARRHHKRSDYSYALDNFVSARALLRKQCIRYLGPCFHAFFSMGKRFYPQAGKLLGKDKAE